MTDLVEQINKLLTNSPEEAGEPIEASRAAGATDTRWTTSQRRPSAA
jgi:hypothetical protein